MQRLCRRQCSGYETVLGSSLLHPMQRGILTTAGLAGTDTSGDSNDAAATEKCDYNLKLLIEGHLTMPRIQTTEDRRLEEARIRKKHWKRWGPYLSERQWGTVREDYSPGGTAWEFFPHDHARSRTYRWGEDGIGGVSDRHQMMCFGLALWNGRDPILKERMFGLTGNEGNHGEDVKEYYFYLDATPTYSYMRMLYKYPQREFPYAQLLEENRRRQGVAGAPEYELLDTGIFDDNRYFDVFVEYAKSDTEDICVRIEVFNRGPEAAELHVLPHLWFRNTWAWTDPPGSEPLIGLERAANHITLAADDFQASALHNLQFPYSLGRRYLYAPQSGQPLFTDNESNAARIYQGASNRKPYVKDAFHRHIVNGEDGVNPAQSGTKACVHYKYSVPARESVVLRLR